MSAPRAASWELTVPDGDLEPLAGALAAMLARTKNARSPETVARRTAVQRLHEQTTAALASEDRAALPTPRRVPA